jgi:hypothetical protein
MMVGKLVSSENPPKVWCEPKKGELIFSPFNLYILAYGVLWESRIPYRCQKGIYEVLGYHGVVSMVTTNRGIRCNRANGLENPSWI